MYLELLQPLILNKTSELTSNGSEDPGAYLHRETSQNHAPPPDPWLLHSTGTQR